MSFCVTLCDFAWCARCSSDTFPLSCVYTPYSCLSPSLATCLFVCLFVCFSVCLFPYDIRDVILNTVLVFGRYCLTIDAQIEQTICTRELEFEAHECASLYTHVLFEERQASEVHRVFRLHDPDNTGFIDSQTMIQAFNKDALLGQRTTVCMQDDHLPSKISFLESGQFYNEMLEQAAKQSAGALAPKDQALLQLSMTKTRVAECNKASDLDYLVMAISEVHFLFQVVSWANVVVLSLYYSDGGELDTSLDPYLICLSLIPWLEVVVGMLATSPGVYLRCHPVHAPVYQNFSVCAASYPLPVRVFLLSSSTSLSRVTKWGE